MSCWRAPFDVPIDRFLRQLRSSISKSISCFGLTMSSDAKPEGEKVEEPENEDVLNAGKQS